MSGRKDKHTRRVMRKAVKRSQRAIIDEFLQTVETFSLKGRLRLAYMIVFKKIRRRV